MSAQIATLADYRAAQASEAALMRRARLAAHRAGIASEAGRLEQRARDVLAAGRGPVAALAAAEALAQRIVAAAPEVA